MKQDQPLGRIANRRIEIDIAEPTYYARDNTNKRLGTVRRALTHVNKAGDKVPFAVVSLDGPLQWEESVFHIVSLMARFRQPLSNLFGEEAVVVNINGDQEWILGCAEDDPRISEGIGSRYLGFGVARLLDKN